MLKTTTIGIVVNILISENKKIRFLLKLSVEYFNKNTIQVTGIPILNMHNYNNIRFGID